MVAIGTGMGVGLERSSASLIGSRGQIGSSLTGRGGDSAFVNAANGNLVITRQDEFLIGLGPDIAISRTYNSQATVGDGDNNDQWRMSANRQIVGANGAPTVTRVDWDGSETVYFQYAANSYATYDGAGDHDTLSWTGTQWLWTDSNTRIKETYDSSGKLLTTWDPDGNTLTYTYSGSLIASVADQNGEHVDFVYGTGAAATQLQQITTVSGGSSIRVRYGYDTSNRLSTVTVDLSPADATIADGKTYVTTYTYDGTSKRVASIAETDGSLLQIGYASTGTEYRVISLTETAATGVTRITGLYYDIPNRVTRITDPLGGVTTMSYDVKGNLTQLVMPAPVPGDSPPTTVYTYAANGDLLSMTENGRRTDYEYDIAGNLTLSRDSAGNTVTRTYGGRNELVTSTLYLVPDPDGAGAGAATTPVTTRYAYDGENHLRYVVSAEGLVTEYRYDRYGQRVSEISYRDNVYSLAGLAPTAAITEATLNAWVSALADKSTTARTDTFYDFRGNISSQVSYASLSVFGESPNSPLGITPGANTSVAQQPDGLYRITKTSGGASAWDADAHSSIKAEGDFVLRLRPGQNNAHVIGGVARAPGNSASYETLEYGFYFVQGGPLYYMESNSWQSLNVNYAAGDSLWLTRVGSTISYYKGATLADAMAAGALRTRTGSTGALYFDSTLYSTGATLDVEFTSQAIVSGVNTTVAQQPDGMIRVTKPTSDGWNADGRSTTRADGDFVFHVKPAQTDKFVIAGVARSPAASSSYDTVDFAFYFAPNGTLYTIENGAAVAMGGYKTGEDFWLSRVGGTVRYYRGATLETAVAAGALRTVNSVAGSFYFDSSIYSQGGAVDVDFAPLPIANGVNTAISQQPDGLFRVSKTGPADSWDADARGTVRAAGDFVLQLRPAQSDKYVIGGVALVPEANASYTNPEFSIYFTPGGTVYYMESGSGLPLATYAAGDNFWLVRTGSTISYYKGATLEAAKAAGALRTRTGVTGTYAFDSALHSVGSILDVSFNATVEVSRTDYIYSPAGQLLSRVSGNGAGRETFVYDGLGRVVSATDKANATTTFLFNDAATTTTATLASGLTRVAAYDKAGELISVTESGANVPTATTNYYYDGLGRLRMETNPNGAATYHVYDNASRKVADIATDGGMTEYSYDVSGRLTKTIGYANKLTAAQIALLDDFTAGGAGGSGTGGVGGGPIGANLVANGGFEASGAYSTTPWGRANPTLPGWTLISGVQYEQVTSGFGGVNATEGAYWLDLDSVPSTVLVPTGSNLLTNASFETSGTYAATAWGRSNATLPGWAKTSGEDFEQVSSGFAGVGATDGVYWLDLDSTPSSTYLPTGANLLTNGGFETSGTYTALSTGRSNTNLPGWTKNNPENFEQVTSGQMGVTAAEGSFWLDLDSVAGPLAPTGSNLIVNGSFETPNIPWVINQDGSYVYLNNPDIPGWKTLNYPWIEQNASGMGGVAASDGNFWLDLEGNSTSASQYFYQTITGLSANQTYQLKFDHANRPEAAGETFQVLWNGVVIATVSPTGTTMITETYQVVAKSGNNELAFVSVGTPDSRGPALDNVRLFAMAPSVGGGNMDVSQTVTGLAANQVMQLEFNHANRTTAASGSFEVWWNNTLVATITDTGTTMQSKLYQVVAQAGSNTLRFKGLGTVDASGASIDNVRLFATVPGPAGGNMDISQTVSIAAAGTMQLQFDHANANPASTGSFEVWWNGSLVTAISETGTGMQTKTYQVNAVAGNNTLRFVGTGTADGAGASLDNVRLRAMQTDPDAGNMNISQTIGGLAPNQVMLLQFDHANRTTAASGSFEVWWNDTLVATIADSGTTMQTKTYSVTASATGGNNVLRFKGTGTCDATGASLDNVRLFATQGGAGGPPPPDQLAGLRPVAHSDDRYQWRVYDSADRLVETIDGTGAVTALSYDGASRLVGTTRYANLLAAATVTAYKSAGPTAVVLPTADSANDRVERSFYRKDGLLAGTLDGEGYLSENVYDGAGLLIETIRYATATAAADRAAGSFATLKAGVTATVNVKDIHNWNVYDGRGLLRGTIDGEGDLTRYHYTAAGDVDQMVRGQKLDPSALIASRPTFASLPTAAGGQITETTTYTRDSAGKVMSEARLLADGTSWTTLYGYDSAGRLTSRTEAAGTSDARAFTQRYDARGNLIGELGGEGSVALAALGANPTAAAVDNVYATWGTIYRYDAADRLTSKTQANGVDALGNRTVYFYRNDLLAFQMNALGEITEYRYNSRGERTDTILYANRLAAATVAGVWGGEVSSDVQAVANSLANPASDSASHVDYNVTGTVRQSVDPLGNTVTYGYTAFGELKTRTDPLEASISVQTDRLYDRRGLLLSEKRDSAAGGLQLETLYGYDAFGRPSQVTDPSGRVRKTDYDRAGRVAVATDARNVTQTFGYDGRGNLLSVTDRNNATTTFTYDAFSRTVTSTTPGQITTTIKHDAHGQTISIKDGALRETVYSYDKDGHLRFETDAVSQVENRYDSAGRLKEAIDARGSKTSYTYDAANRLFTEKVNDGGLNLTTTYEYDAKGQNFKITDPSNRVTLVEFDKAGRKAAITVDSTGLAIRTQYDYDKSGRLLFVTEAQGTPVARVTQFEYDKADRLIRTRVDPAGLNLLTQYSYDKAGNVARKTDAANFVTTYSYDAENRLTRTLDPEGGVVETFYDNEGRIAGTRRYANAGTAAATADGGFTISVSPDNGHDEVSAYFYDSDGRLRISVDGIGRPTETVYDDSGNVVRSIDYAGAIAYAIGDSLAVIQGRTAALANLADNRVTRAVYDGANRQAYAIDATGQVTAFGYDGSGNVIKRVRYAVLFAGTNNPSFAEMGSWTTANANVDDRVDRTFYDGASRATFSVDAENYVTQTQYDADGRVTAQIRHASKTYSTGDSITEPNLVGQIGLPQANAAVTGFTYDSAGRLTDTTGPTGSVTHLVLDKLGQATDVITAYNVPADSSTTHRVFDKAGRVQSETRASGTPEYSTTTFTYDGMGRMRTATDMYNVTKEYIYDGLGRCIHEIQPLNAAQTAHTYKAYDKFGNLVKLTDPRNNATYFHYDALDRLVWQTDPEGYVTKTTYTRGDEVASVTRFAAAVSGTTVATPPAVVANAALDSTTIFDRDKLDRLKGVTDGESKTEIYTLNAFGDRISVKNKIDGTTLNTFDKRGLLTQETLPVGSTRADGSIAAANIVNKYDYDSRGNLITKTEALGIAGEQRITNFVYDKADRLKEKSGDAVYAVTSLVSGTGGMTVPTETYGYDARGNLIETATSWGARTLAYYDDADRKTAEIDALGTLRQWDYDRNGNVVAARIYGDPVSLPVTAGGTAPGPVNAANYRETTYSYDKNNRLFETRTAGLLTGQYDGGYATSTAVVILQNFYDSAGNLVREVDGRGYSVYSYYDRAGRKVAKVDQERYLTSYALDGEGNVLTEERFANRVASADEGSDPVALRNSVLGGSGNRVTTFTYDRNGRRKSETRLAVDARSLSTTGVLQQASGNAQILYDYNGLGQITRKTEANLDVTDFEYDSIGRQTAIQSAPYIDFENVQVRRRTETAYNGLGLVTRSVEKGKLASDDRVTTFTYGAGGRLDQVKDPGATIYTHKYDAAGNLVMQTFQRSDSAGTATSYANAYRYDLLNRATTQSVLTWVTASAAWSEGDRSQTRFNAYGDVSGKGVNVVGEAYQETFDYDGAGQLWRSNSGDGVWRFYVHDAAGNQTLTVESEGADLQGYTLASAVASANLGAGYGDGVNGTIAVFDKRGQQITTIQPNRELSAGAARVMLTSSRTYNAFGEVSSETDARNATTDFVYNTMGRMTEKDGAAVSYTNAAGVTLDNTRPVEKYYYDISGRMIGYRDANSVLANPTNDNSAATTRALVAGTGHDGGEALVAAEFHPDAGIFRTAYDVFGDARILRDELGYDELRSYDSMGRLTTQVHRGQLLTDYYAYDSLGQRIKHWNSFLTGAGSLETTDYDASGRVTKQVTFGGLESDFGYVWDGAIATPGLGTFGGWAKTTTTVSGSSTERTDLFGRTVSRIDQGQHPFTLTYDKAGRLIQQNGMLGESQTYSYFNTGRAFQIVDMPDDGNGVTATFGYDADGNRTYEGYSGPTTLLQNATIEYDALGRMTKFTDYDSSGTVQLRKFANQYDLAGNIRHSTSTFPDIANPQFVSQSSDHWFAYDNMNRMTIANGQLVGGAIVTGETGETGVALTYDAAGRRRTATQRVALVGYATVTVQDSTTGGGHTGRTVDGGIDGEGSHTETVQSNYMGQRREEYDYRADGYLMNVSFAEEGYYDGGSGYTVNNGVMSSAVLRAANLRDNLGRVTQYQEYDSGGAISQNHYNIVYDAASRVISDVLSQKRLESSVWYTYTTTSSNQYYGLGGALSYSSAGVVKTWTNSNGGTSSSSSSNSTSYNYVLWDDAKVSSSTFTNAGVSGTSTYAYDGFGRVASVSITGTRPHSVTFTNSPTGQVLSRVESSTAAKNPADYYYFVDGVQVGELTNNGLYDPTRTNYSDTFVTRNWNFNANTSPTAFRWDNTGPYNRGQFGGSGYDPISPQSQGMKGADSRYTVRDGDTLAGIAASLWGDGSLWYMLAEANGLVSDQGLVAGTSLIIPDKVTNLHNSASTFEVYDPNRALGDLSATAAPKPPKKANGCGIFGQILVMVVAAVATHFLGPIGGNLVTQGFANLIGVQKGFSWKSLALSMLTAEITQGIGASGIFNGIGNATVQAAATAVAANVATQGVSVATGLQKKFDWVSVATAGVGAAVSQQIHVPGPGGNMLRTAADGFASAATRSLLTGTSFGDNIIAVLPEVIGRSIGNALAEAIEMAGSRGDHDATVRKAQGTTGTGEAKEAYDGDGRIGPGGDPLQAVSAWDARRQRIADSLPEKDRSNLLFYYEGMSDAPADVVRSVWERYINGEIPLDRQIADLYGHVAEYDPNLGPNGTSFFDETVLGMTGDPIFGQFATAEAVFGDLQEIGHQLEAMVWKEAGLAPRDSLGDEGAQFAIMRSQQLIAQSGGSAFKYGAGSLGDFTVDPSMLMAVATNEIVTGAVWLENRVGDIEYYGPAGHYHTVFLDSYNAAIRLGRDAPYAYRMAQQMSLGAQLPDMLARYDALTSTENAGAGFVLGLIPLPIPRVGPSIADALSIQSQIHSLPLIVGRIPTNFVQLNREQIGRYVTDAVRNENFALAGVASHYLGDSYAHTYKENGTWWPFRAGPGHADGTADRGHRWDNMYFRPNLAAAYSKDLIGRIVDGLVKPTDAVMRIPNGVSKLIGDTFNDWKGVFTQGHGSEAQFNKVAADLERSAYIAAGGRRSGMPAPLSQPAIDHVYGNYPLPPRYQAAFDAMKKRPTLPRPRQ